MEKTYQKGTLNLKKLTLKIAGMMCENCEKHVNQAIETHFPVEQVQSSHQKGETVIIAPQELDESALKAVVEEAGYRFLAMKTEDYREHKGFMSKFFG